MLEEDAAAVDRFGAILMPHLRIGSPEDRAAVRGTSIEQKGQLDVWSREQELVSRRLISRKLYLSRASIF